MTSLECLGGKCPMLAECFPEKAKAASREADVVVTNHAMLGIAASGLARRAARSTRCSSSTRRTS